MVIKKKIKFIEKYNESQGYINEKKIFKFQKKMKFSTSNNKYLIYRLIYY
jgi:hypothetical protein